MAQREPTQARALRIASGGRQNAEADALDANATKLDDKLLEIAAESEIKRESVRHEKWLKEHEHYLAWHLENSRSVIALSQSACRVVVTVNAGAAVALLAFLGNALAKDEHIVARMFAAPLLTFAMGVVVSALVAASSYFTQFVYGGETSGVFAAASGHVRPPAVPTSPASALGWRHAYSPA